MHTKIRREGRFIRERLRNPRALRRAGMHFRTVQSGRHRIVLAFPSGRKKRGAGIVQAILHPLSEASGGARKFICRDVVCRRIAEE